MKIIRVTNEAKAALEKIARAEGRYESEQASRIIIQEAKRYGDENGKGQLSENETGQRNDESTGRKW